MQKKSISLVREYEAPAAILFDAIRQGALFRSTGIREAHFRHDFREGGQYSLEWKSKGKSSGRYLEIVENKRISFTWTSTDCNSATPDETKVTVTIIDCGERSTLQLVHDGLADGFCFDDHLKGWTESLSEFFALVAVVNSVTVNK